MAERRFSMSAHSSRKVFSLLILVGFVLQACATAAPPTPTLAPPSSTPSAAPTATDTPIPSATPSPTATPNAAATQQYQSFMQRIQQFQSQGDVANTPGTYSSIDDTEMTFANPGYYHWTAVGTGVHDFVIRTDLTMETSKQSFERGGCGFVVGDSNLMMLSQKGNVYRFDPIFGLGPTNYLGEASNPWSTELALIFKQTGDKYTGIARLFIAGKERLKASMRLGDGGISLAVISGSDTDFGTRCQFKNTDLWTTQ
jgi:hypothetical protein